MNEAAAVVTEHGPYVLRALRHLGVPEADLPDLSQDVLLIVLRKLDAFEGRSSLRTWIYGICLRVTADYRKRQRRRRSVFAAAGAALGRAAVPARQLEALCERRQLDEIEAALARLSAEQRRAFLLADVEQHSMHEVAAALGCPLKTAFSRLYAARRRLKEALGGELAELLPALAPIPAALGSAGDAERLTAVWRGLLPHAAPPVPVASAKAALAAWLMGPLVGLASLASVASPLAPPAMHIACADVARDAPLPGPRFTRIPAASAAEPSRPQSRGTPRAPLRSPSTQEAEPGAVRATAFAVDHVAVPNAHLLFHRVALSEVVPYYAVPE